MITCSLLRPIFASRFSPRRIGQMTWSRFLSWGGFFCICLMAITGCQEPPVINTPVDRDAETKQPAPAAHEHQETATGMMILGV